MTKYELILSYLLNNEIRLDEEINQLQQNIRFRKIHDVDMIELLIATVRRDTFLEVSQNIRDLLNMK